MLKIDFFFLFPVLLVRYLSHAILQSIKILQKVGCDCNFMLALSKLTKKQTKTSIFNSIHVYLYSTSIFITHISKQLYRYAYLGHTVTFINTYT